MVGNHHARRVRGVYAKRGAVGGNGAQIELIQIGSAQGQKQSATADVSSAQDQAMGQFVFDAEVEVVGERRALRTEHGVERLTKVIAEAGGRGRDTAERLHWGTDCSERRGRWCWDPRSRASVAHWSLPLITVLPSALKQVASHACTAEKPSLLRPVPPTMCGLGPK